MDNYIRYFIGCFFILLFIIPESAFGKHIIGGFMRYDHLGGGRYRFQLFVYRDCRPQENAAPLDSPIDVGVYYQNNNGSSYQLVRQITPTLRRAERVLPPDFACLTLPPSLCVEEGYYEFEYRIEGWPRSGSVILAYQRCCRNNTISNIATPGEVGATFTVEITPYAMATGNSSPDFKEFPPTAICNAFPLEFDHSAVDPDGDSLAYVFCSPLVGGGLAGSVELPSGSASACNGVSPAPACPPPYGPVTFLSPHYTVSLPLGGAPAVTLDSQTGLIAGTPNILGQFVAAVCVEEWRNGQLLSVTRRDFQFNVTDCTASVNADMIATEKLDEKLYYIKSCGSLEVDIENISTDKSKIERFEWQLDINGIDESYDTEHLKYVFPDYGRYYGILIANPNLPCVDSAYVIIDIFEEIKADFSFTYDTCEVSPVHFTNNSYSLGGNITDIHWDFGDGNTDVNLNPIHSYASSNSYNVSLQVTDENGCVDVLVLPLMYYPIPFDIFIEPLDTIDCQPLIFDFDRISNFITDDYIINWDFGDGSFSDAARPVHIYKEAGTYSIKFNVENIFGCKAETVFINSVTVLVTPEADFSFSPIEITRLDPEVFFNNNSVNADRYIWDFGDGSNSTQFNPIHSFLDTGLLNVSLISIHGNGCRDTAYALIDNVPEITYFMPNAFSPNSDGTNDFFFGKGYLDGYRFFEFRIFNRYGQLLFESTDPEERWNGRLNNEGELQKPDVYVYKVEVTDPRGKLRSLSGTFMLVR